MIIANRYIKGNALELAVLCRLAYDSPAKITKVLRFNRVQHISKKSTGTQLFVASSYSTLIIVIRGTNDYRDWLTNLDMGGEQEKIATDFDRYVSVHPGFNRAVTSIITDVVTAINEFKTRGGEYVYITGHSLGGAVASLLSIRLETTHDICVENVYTFGSPRVLCERFGTYVARHIFRVENGNDGAPKVPMHGYALGDLHVVGTLKENGNWWQKFQNYFKKTQYTHHDINKYIKSIKAS